MKKYLLYTLFLLLALPLGAQSYKGKIFMKEEAYVYLNHIYVTNLRTHKTVLSSTNGDFNINAQEGDIIRFTSIITHRKDVKVAENSLNNIINYIELRPEYHEIQELIISFKPTGVLKKDVMALKKSEKAFEIAKMVGLPEPKGDGTSPVAPVADFANGGLTFSVDTIYDILSGDQKKKTRLNDYEKMNRNISSIRAYYGNDYFEKLKIPENLVDNFLQFVYTSDNLSHFIEYGNLEGTKPYIEKYLPIYIKRLNNSNLMRIND